MKSTGSRSLRSYILVWCMDNIVDGGVEVLLL